MKVFIILIVVFCAIAVVIVPATGIAHADAFYSYISIPVSDASELYNVFAPLMQEHKIVVNHSFLLHIASLRSYMQLNICQSDDGVSDYERFAGSTFTSSVGTYSIFDDYSPLNLGIIGPYVGMNSVVITIPIYIGYYRLDVSFHISNIDQQILVGSMGSSDKAIFFLRIILVLLTLSC
jgi:hypothetical protein